MTNNAYTLNKFQILTNCLPIFLFTWKMESSRQSNRKIYKELSGSITRRVSQKTTLM
jgi:hypothetical protein